MKNLISLFLFLFMQTANALPSGFVYLQDVDPTIVQDIRYAGTHNFVGRPIQGYKAKQCILTKDAAYALKKIQQQLLKQGLSLRVYDCYRPVQAVNDFVEWSRDERQQEMKQEFYPHVDKKDLFKLGYIAERSGHSRGSTIDLTLVKVNKPATSVDMGTGFDYMDVRSHSLNYTINKRAYRHRSFLRRLMVEHGFIPYEKEWWHFTFKNEPYPHNYFNFQVE